MLIGKYRTEIWIFGFFPLYFNIISTMSIRVGEPVYINGKQGRYLGICRFYGWPSREHLGWRRTRPPLGKERRQRQGRAVLLLPAGRFCQEETVEPANMSAAPRHPAPAGAAATNAGSGTTRCSWCIRLRLLLLATALFCQLWACGCRSAGATASRRKIPIYIQRLCFPKGDQPVERARDGACTPVLRSIRHGPPYECTRHHCSSEPHHRAGDQLEPNIGSDRAWVFRAKSEILALATSSHYNSRIP